MKPHVISLKEISQRFKAEEFNVGQDLEIGNINTLEMAKEGEISFIVRKKFLPVARVSLASAFIAPKGLVVDDRPTLCVDDVWKVVKELINYFYPPMIPQPGIAPEARIGRDVLLGKDVYIGPYTIIEDEVSIGDSSMIASHCYVGRKAKLGANTVIHPQVTIMHEVIIGNRVIIHPGAVIGSDGFKYEIIDGQRQKIPQVGRVVVEDDVEIGANSCVDRATLTETRIGQGTKIDNLVQIGHNVTIGGNCVLVGQVGIAGSSSLGNNVILGGQVGIADNLKLGDNVAVGAQSGVRKDIPSGEYHFGSPSLPMKEFSRILALMTNLPKMHKKLNELWAIIKEKKSKD